MIMFAGNGRRVYSGAELEYAYLIHSIYLLSRLLCYTNGRALFPVKIKDRDGLLSVFNSVIVLPFCKII